MTPEYCQLVRIAFAGQNHIDEWRLGDPTRAAALGYPRGFPCGVFDDYGMVFIDVTLDADTGKPVCHEVNGPNGVGSDALTGDSIERAQNEARQAQRRAREMGVLTPDGRLHTAAVTLHAHQHWPAFRTGTEFYPRVLQFGECLAALLPGNDIRLRGAGELLGLERLAVVMGDVPAIAADLRLQRKRRRFEYQGRPVVFIGNPNLLPELVRTSKLTAAEQQSGEFNARVFHAWRLTNLVHDKARQQVLLEGTGIEPLPHFEAFTQDEALQKTRRLLERGAVVLKPNGASGGTGVHVAVAHMTDREIRGRIDAVLADCVAKYGANSEAAALPIRGFRFVRSTDYPMSDGAHLWDLRIAVPFEPGLAQVYPVSMRITPEPFDAATFHQDRDQWISNVSGRQTTLLKSGMDDEALTAVGMTSEKLDQVFRACVAWCAKAWDASIRAGGRNGSVYEDDCEREDNAFYPRQRFCA